MQVCGSLLTVCFCATLQVFLAADHSSAAVAAAWLGLVAFSLVIR